MTHSKFRPEASLEQLEQLDHSKMGHHLTNAECLNDGRRRGAQVDRGEWGLNAGGIQL